MPFVRTELLWRTAGGGVVAGRRVHRYRWRGRPGVHLQRSRAQLGRVGVRSCVLGVCYRLRQPVSSRCIAVMTEVSVKDLTLTRSQATFAGAMPPAVIAVLPAVGALPTPHIALDFRPVSLPCCRCCAAGRMKVRLQRPGWCGCFRAATTGSWRCGTLTCRLRH